MDTERVTKAHPAYPFIIRQLSADEAKGSEAIRNAEEPFKCFGRSQCGPVSPDNVEKDDFPHNDSRPSGECAVLHEPPTATWSLLCLITIGRTSLSGGPPISKQSKVSVFYRYLLRTLGSAF